MQASSLCAGTMTQMRGNAGENAVDCDLRCSAVYRRAASRPRGMEIMVRMYWMSTALQYNAWNAAKESRTQVRMCKVCVRCMEGRGTVRNVAG